MKVTKAKAPLLPASLRFAPGNLRCSVMGCTAKLVLRCARRSNRRGESVHVAVAICDATAQPTPCAPRRMQKGWGPEYRGSFLVRWALRPTLMLYPFSRVREKVGMRGLLASMLLIAAGALQVSARGLNDSNDPGIASLAGLRSMPYETDSYSRAQSARQMLKTPNIHLKRTTPAGRWKSGCPTPFCQRRGAQGMGCVVAPQSATTSCTDSRQLFDWSAQRERSSAAQPMPEHHRLPRSAAKGTLAAGRISLPTFLLRNKKVGRPPGRTPGICAQRRQSINSTTKLAKAPTAPSPHPLPQAREGERK